MKHIRTAAMGLAGLLFALAPLVQGAQTDGKPAAGPAQRQPELPVVFDDDLSEAPFNRYKSLGRGESDWQAKTHWILKAPSGFVMPARCGAEAAFSVRMSFPRLAREGENSESRLGFVFANSQMGVVAFVRKHDGSRVVGKVVVLRQPDIVGQVGVQVRELKLEDDLPSGNWSLRLKSGALTISCDGREIGRGALETRAVPVIGVAIAQPVGSLTVQRLTLRGTSFPAELSAQQRQQALAASSLNDEVGRLLASKKYADATEKGRRVVEMYQKLYGQSHHDVANALLNLGMVLKYDGKTGEAVDYLKRALAVRQELFGVDHPDTAQLEMELTVLLVERMDLEAAFKHCMAAHFSFALYYGDEYRSTILTRQMLDKLPPPKREDET